ncbi:unnamed protein product, partial [Meganyctiphanes norvegica]
MVQLEYVLLVFIIFYKSFLVAHNINEIQDSSKELDNFKFNKVSLNKHPVIPESLEKISPLYIPMKGPEGWSKHYETKKIISMNGGENNDKGGKIISFQG